MTLTQLFLIIFLIFALSRVIARFRSAEVSISGLMFWSTVFGTAIVAISLPHLTTQIAQSIGIGRGVDAVVYVSVVLLFYLVFRLYIYIQDLRREISELVSKLALKEYEDAKKKSGKDQRHHTII